MSLKGKVAVITGAGTGIGAAIARRFVADGAKVCITGRRRELLEKLKASLPAGSAVVCAGDVSIFDDASRMVTTAVNFGGRLDVLVNNAGIDPPGSIVEVEPELWKKVIDTNLTGPFFTMKAAIPRIIQGGGGSVINIASLAGIRCLPAMPAYCSSKAGLIMLTQQAALDYGPSRVRCNIICPGGVKTEMLEHAMTPMAETLKTDIDGALARLTAYSPLRRIGLPGEISGICSFLAGDDSSFMTGSVVVADGGASIVDVNGAAVNSTGLNWGGGK
jgi:meso-butanediol dehydrogenase/(S,S)-butanediol dehydrogenase/diacetyl reductase